MKSGRGKRPARLEFRDCGRRLLLRHGEQPGQILPDVVEAAATAALEFFLIGYLHIPAAAIEHCRGLKTAGDQSHRGAADPKQLRQRVLGERDFAVSAPLLNLKQPAADACLDGMGRVAQSRLLRLNKLRAVEPRGTVSDAGVLIQNVAVCRRRHP